MFLKVLATGSPLALLFRLTKIAVFVVSLYSVAPLLRSVYSLHYTIIMRTYVMHSNNQTAHNIRLFRYQCNPCFLTACTEHITSVYTGMAVWLPVATTIKG